LILNNIINRISKEERKEHEEEKLSAKMIKFFITVMERQEALRNNQTQLHDWLFLNEGFNLKLSNSKSVT